MPNDVTRQGVREGRGGSARTGRLSGPSDYGGEWVGQDLLEIQFHNSRVGEGEREMGKDGGGGGAGSVVMTRRVMT